MRLGPSILLWLLTLPVFAQTQTSTEFFEKRIRPVLATQCQGCHNAKLKTAGLDLSSAEAFAHGGQSGTVIVAGKPEDSRLIKAIGYSETLKMPPAGKLAAEETADLTEWVKTGAGVARSRLYASFAGSSPVARVHRSGEKVLGIPTRDRSRAACCQG